MPEQKILRSFRQQLAEKAIGAKNNRKNRNWSKLPDIISFF
jgi:hypothetical protein